MLSKLFKQVENEYCQEQQKKKDEQAKAGKRWEEHIKETEMLNKMSNSEIYIYKENKLKQEQEERQKRKQDEQDELKSIGEASQIVENEIKVYMNNINPEAKEQYDKHRFAMNLININRARSSLLLDNFKSLLESLKIQSNIAAHKEVTYSNLLPVHGELTHYSELVKMFSIINKQIEDYKTLLQNIPFRCEKQEPKPPVVVRRTKE
jgi:hypothetical protein